MFNYFLLRNIYLQYRGEKYNYVSYLKYTDYIYYNTCLISIQHKYYNYHILFSTYMARCGWYYQLLDPENVRMRDIIHWPQSPGGKCRNERYNPLTTTGRTKMLVLWENYNKPNIHFQLNLQSHGIIFLLNIFFVVVCKMYRLGGELNSVVC